MPFFAMLCDPHDSLVSLQELETVDLEVNDLIAKANKGGDMSNIKSAASGEPSLLSVLNLPWRFSNAAWMWPHCNGNKGRHPICSYCAGIEQQINALKAIVGFD